MAAGAVERASGANAESKRTVARKEEQSLSGFSRTTLPGQNGPRCGSPHAAALLTFPLPGLIRAASTQRKRKRGGYSRGEITQRHRLTLHIKRPAQRELHGPKGLNTLAVWSVTSSWLADC
jgi:hypothetical protein